MFFHLVRKETHINTPFKKLRTKNKFIKNNLRFIGHKQKKDLLIGGPLNLVVLIRI